MAAILYLSTSYIPFRRADSMHVMHMCQALAKSGSDVKLVHKKSKVYSEETKDVFEFYGVKPNFTLVPVSRPHFKGGGLLYSFNVHRLLKSFRKSVDLIFSRDIEGALSAMKLGLPLIFEIHVIPDSERNMESMRRILKYDKLISVVLLTRQLLSDFETSFNSQLNGQKLIVAHDAYTPGTTPTTMRESDGNRINIGYAGNLYPGKGMEVFCELAKRMPHYNFNIAGGEEKDINKWQSTYDLKNLTFLGFRPPSELPGFYQDQDILLLPPLKESLGLSGNNIAKWMSPMKLFEYMNAGRPIVASSLDVLQEVITHEENGLIADPDNLELWEVCINRLIADKDLARRLASKALEDLHDKYTWDRRVEHIMSESNI